MNKIKTIIVEREKDFDRFFLSIGGGTALNEQEEVIAQKENIKSHNHQTIKTILRSFIEIVKEHEKHMIKDVDEIAILALSNIKQQIQDTLKITR